MATSSSVILLIVAGSFLGAAYGGNKLHVPPAQDISSFTFQLRTIYGNTSMSNGSGLSKMTEGGGRPRLMEKLPDADENLNIYALPVGQGDCTVIQCPRRDGNKITIIDAGSGTEGIGFNRERLVKFLSLRERGANRVTIQSIFLTHPDEDHINYIDAILNAYGSPVDVYHSCGWEHYNDLAHAHPIQVPSCCGRNCIPPITLCEGGDQGNVILRVIGSEYTGNNCTNNKNGDSIVSTIEYRGVKTLITGDFEGNGEFVQNFIRDAGNLLRASIYRLSNHGAYNGNANRIEFLEAINAKYVFSSSGFLYGHPRCELYDYYVTQRVEAPEEQKLAAAERHIYTCQNVIPPNERLVNEMHQRVPQHPERAIYVTTVGEERNELNYVIQFKIIINRHGGANIESSARRVRV